MYRQIVFTGKSGKYSYIQRIVQQLIFTANNSNNCSTKNTVFEPSKSVLSSIEDREQRIKPCRWPNRKHTYASGSAEAAAGVFDCFGTQTILVNVIPSKLINKPMREDACLNLDTDDSKCRTTKQTIYTQLLITK